MASIKRPAKIEYLDEIIEFILNEGHTLGFEKALLSKINLACEEAIVNVVKYAYDDTNGQIEIRINPPPDGQGMMIDIIDWGKPFNPLEKPAPDINAAVEDRPIGGLGIFMIRKIMDEVEYFREEPINHLRMLKYL